MLDNFEINDYKCFKDFKIDNLSQINIISGKNNVGKTAFLELVSIIKNSKNLRLFQENINSIFISRDLDREDINRYFENINLVIKTFDNTTSIEHKIIDDLTDEEFLKIERYGNTIIDFLVMYSNYNLIEIIPFRIEEINLFIGRFKNTLETTFINSSKPNNSKLTPLYSKVQDLGLERKEKFLEYLKLIDNNIIHIEPQIRENRKSFLRISLDNQEQSLISSELGEGTNRFIEILCILLTNANGIVLIDEIENGIHHTKLYDIWKAIIEIVDKENIQLFVTTHDKESIEALLNASRDSNYNKITSIKLFRNEENKIKPIIKNFEILEYGIDMGVDVR